MVAVAGQEVLPLRGSPRCQLLHQEHEELELRPAVVEEVLTAVDESGERGVESGRYGDVPTGPGEDLVQDLPLPRDADLLGLQRYEVHIEEFGGEDDGRVGCSGQLPFQFHQEGAGGLVRPVDEPAP
ncbi:hypothetical protein GCM10023084_73420 [Streptomyces lacrimifluminis]|uniref:Uncharacterized protein n=1 Tax=Streptomyces lacrimifluminis TaxID=1500077 RepID=A0A917P6I1_9ACTN|nr:hypothetical protein GCM10012282_71500 [Streptomyces lacrimifluminis]